ncbi:unnamed protein product [Cylindrotheca closterium]|nr:unnamed protein product [Cylindrotheca closterium]
MEAALNWVSEIAQCKELKMFDSSGSSGYYTNYKNQQSSQQAQQDQGQYYDKQYQYQQTSSPSQNANSYKASLRNPYAGMMCNSDGSGMEIGIFMDAYCTIYDSSRTYKDIIKNGSPQKTYYELTKGLMEFTFTQPIECKANEYTEPDFDSRADYEYYQQQQQQQQEATSQYYADAEEFYNAYSQQQDETYQQTNEYYQEQSDAYYSYYMDGSNVQAANSCQQLFQQQVVQLGIPCYDNGQQQNNQDQTYSQSYTNQDKPYGEYSYFSAYNGRQSYAYEIQNPYDQDEVCTVMNSKASNDSFQKNAMSQSRFKNLYNYKLYSATTSWRGFRTRIGEKFQTFRYNTGERFRSIHEEEISTKLAIISFLIVASIAIVYVISRFSAPYVAKGLTTAASHAADHAERLVEHVKSMKSMRDEDSSYGHTLTQDSAYQFSEIESFDFYDEAQAEPSGKKHRLFY